MFYIAFIPKTTEVLKLSLIRPERLQNFFSGVPRTVFHIEGKMRHFFCKLYKDCGVEKGHLEGV